MFLNNANQSDVNALLKTLSASVKNQEKKEFRAFVYFLNGNAKDLKLLNKSLKLDNIALCLIPDNVKKETLGKYKINPKAKSTVIVYESRKVDSVFVDYNDKKDSKKLVSAIAKICK